VVRKRSLGLKGRYKLLGQAGIAAFVCLVGSQ
jgi:hypothetical protein